MEFVEFKTCVKCNTLKPLDCFHKSKGKLHGVRNDCSDCVSIYTREYRTKNKQKIKEKKHLDHKNKPYIKRRSHLKNKYNLSLEDYESMIIRQDGKCAICKSESPKNKQHKNLYIDHNHKTGKVREILCHRCNSAIGMCEENIDTLKEIIRYLEKHNIDTN